MSEKEGIRCSSAMLRYSYLHCLAFLQEKSSLKDLWEERKELYDQCMKLMVFYRDVEQAEAWMAKYEVSFCDNIIYSPLFLRRVQ